MIENNDHANIPPQPWVRTELVFSLVREWRGGVHLMKWDDPTIALPAGHSYRAHQTADTLWFQKKSWTEKSVLTWSFDIMFLLLFSVISFCSKHADWLEITGELLRSSEFTSKQVLVSTQEQRTQRAGKVAATLKWHSRVFCLLRRIFFFQNIFLQQFPTLH